MERKHFVIVVVAVSILSGGDVLPTIGYGQIIGREAGSVGAAIDFHRNQARQEAELRAWKNTKKLTIQKQIPAKPHQQDLDPEFLKDDSFGYLEWYEFHVLQVLSANEVLLNMQNPDVPIICLTDCETKGLVDDEKVRLAGPMEVCGSKSYSTVTGAKKTVRMIRFLTEDQLKARKAQHELEMKAKREAEERAEEARRKAAEEKLFRKWTSSDKKHSIEAKFLRYEKGLVYLEQRNGKVRTVKLTRLTKDDQQYCRELGKKQVKAQKQKKVEARNKR